MQQIIEFHLDVRATPHTLRHTHASHLVNAGVPTVHVKEVLGHRYLSSTRVYTHATKEALYSSSQALFEGLAGAIR